MGKNEIKYSQTVYHLGEQQLQKSKYKIVFNDLYKY
jgi:hypothetical protein